jgi:hypothetical protein
MNFTREELEDIWNNKPYGYFTELRKKKDLRKYKKYVIEAKILKNCGTKTITVHDTKVNGVMVQNARNVLRQQILDEFGEYVTVNYRIYQNSL